MIGFIEKLFGDGGSWINGGFFVFNLVVIEYIVSEDILWEGVFMVCLVEMGELNMFEYYGFW